MRDSEDYKGKVELLELEKLNGPWAYSDNKIFFVIPVFMYRAGLVCSHKEIVKEVEKKT